MAILRLLHAVLLATAVVFAAPVAAQARAAGADASATPTALENERDELPVRLGIQGSYGLAVPINGSTDIDFGSFMFRWTRALTGDSVLGGEAAWGFEAGGFGFDQTPTAFGFGGHLLFEHRFVPEAGFHPLLRVGIGALGSNEGVPPGETRHNFSLYAEAAVEWRLTSRSWLHTGYRLHHVSNADTGTRNLGINAHALTLGFTWLPGPTRLP